MTELFTRHGSLHTGFVATDSKGKPFFTRNRKCSRCGGAGRSDKWARTGFTCFDCGGLGHRGTENVALFTQAELDRLNAAQAKRNATKQAKFQAAQAQAQAEADARRDSFLAEHHDLLSRAALFVERDEFVRDVHAKAMARFAMTDGQAVALANAIDRIVARDAQKAASKHFGKIGERFTADVKVERIASFPTAFGVKHIVTMRDHAGHCIVSKGSFHAERGEELTIKATVKEHGEFRGELQTIVQRVAW